MDSVGSGSDSPWGEPGRDEQDRRLVGHRVRQVEPAQLAPRRGGSGRSPRAARAGRPSSGSSSSGTPPSGISHDSCSRVIPMLADEDDPVVVVDRDDAGREVGEMHDAVDPGVAVGAGHLVVPDGDPRVLVGDAAAVPYEAAVHARHRRTARAGPSAPRDGGPRLPDVTDPDPRPASEPRHEVAVDWDVRIPARDGVELSANIWRPLPRPDAPDERLPGHPRDDPVRQGQLAAGVGHRPAASGSRPAATRCAGSTSAAPDRPAASRSTSTPPTRRATATTRSSGWRRSRGATAPSACGGSATAGSPRSRSRPCGRRTCARSCRSWPRTTAISTTSTTAAAASRSASCRSTPSARSR